MPRFAKRVMGGGEHFEFGKMETPAKRRRALLESNPLRNTRRELIAWPDGKFTRTLRPAVFREPRNRFPDALKNSWGALWGGPVRGAGVVGPGAACQRRLYRDVVGVGRRHLGQGVILVARQLVLFESPTEV